MIPDNRLSTEILAAELLSPRDIPYQPLVNFELGGVGLNNPSQGLQVKTWKGELVDNSITLSADDVAPVAVVTDTGITEFQFTFDQNMRPFVCWVAALQAKFYWYDSTIEGFATTVMAPTVKTPRCVLDDKRPLQVGASDIILAYIRNDDLFFRMQRDRYTIEYPLLENARRLIQVGMGFNNRLQFIVRL